MPPFDQYGALPPRRPSSFPRLQAQLAAPRTGPLGYRQPSAAGRARAQATLARFRATQAARAAGRPLIMGPAPSSSSAPSTAGCSRALVAAGVSCEQQAGLRRMGVSPAAALQQQQAQARASGGYVSRQAAPSYPTSATSTSSTTWQPGPAAAPAGSTYLARPIDTLRGRFAAALRGHSLVPGQTTQQGYQTTGAYYPPAQAPQSTGLEAYPAGVPEAANPLTALAPAQVPQTEAGQADAIRSLYQQSRTARGLHILDHPVMQQPGGSLEQVALVISGLADPDRRMTPGETTGYLYQVSSEQAVRVGNLSMASLLASLASRYPVPRALAGIYELGGIAGVSWGGWATTAALVLAASVGVMWIRDARMAELTPRGRTRHDGYPKSRNNSRRRR